MLAYSNTKMIPKDKLYMHQKQNSDSEGNLIDTLNNKLEIYRRDSILHKKHEKWFRKLFNLLQYPSFIISLILSVLSGSLSLKDADDQPFILSLFMLSLISTILQGSVNFFKVKEKEAKYAFCSAQYSDIVKKLEAYLLRHHDKDDYADMLENILNQELLLDEIKLDFTSWIK